MLRTVNNDIYMMRGDSVGFILSTANSMGQPYLVKPEDSIPL